MKISTKGRYGLRAILDVALNEKEGPVTINSIAKRQEISERYLEQLLIVMKQRGLIKSIRGFQGGYLLNKEPREISVGDVIRALEGPIAPVDCVNDDDTEQCSRSNYCVTKIVWEDLKQSITKVLDSYSLRDLMEEEEKVRSIHVDNYCI
ncbi:transcriptional regulator, BadM/Rrf2 family [Syntrophobotulus glycolicus DSM 8271]|uniref:Transcriptional regulator, BadM/Rrf2 family n=1 Tax=Syntrophobotulus glycolicus (strain DSM 8271 / FlGlyR) TaxID=645991 RepID=F0SYI9_SYNGF|nr:Rrf2 family transcriptional regulator [Syntrophobotulus glycolicus]ADY57101.1 transcriptional regulator, BadM/Rrf2 family [Syntrophobotulus glycolicus DSM 8271]